MKKKPAYFVILEGNNAKKHLIFVIFKRKKNAKDQPTQYIKKQCTKKGGGFFRHFLIHLEEI